MSQLFFTRGPVAAARRLESYSIRGGARVEGWGGTGWTDSLLLDVYLYSSSVDASILNTWLFKNINKSENRKFSSP